MAAVSARFFAAGFDTVAIARGKDKEALTLLPVMEKALAMLQAGKPARMLRRDLAPERARARLGVEDAAVARAAVAQPVDWAIMPRIAVS